ncbi:unnamed protein product [Polarella glacialis]|uniref:Uncharacterized protein n=1 Tax=Polarella glacialis TaxID=89957 RepID=A0A813M6Y2_POLGL|nr:unnamed protein product [Polarella glacialis]
MAAERLAGAGDALVRFEHEVTRRGGIGQLCLRVHDEARRETVEVALGHKTPLQHLAVALCDEGVQEAAGPEGERQRKEPQLPELQLGSLRLLPGDTLCGLGLLSQDLGLGGSAVGRGNGDLGSCRGAREGGRGGLAMAAILALVAETYHMGVYAALSYLSSQLLVAALRPDATAALARWQDLDRRSAWARCEDAVRVSCLCGSCCWFVPAAWLTPPPPASGEARSGRACTVEKVSCCCTFASISSGTQASRCPTPGCCESYTRWLTARCGISIPSLRWLWLPAGMTATDCNSGPGGGLLARGIAAQAEPLTEVECSRSQRFRCRSCKVETYNVDVGDDIVRQCSELWETWGWRREVPDTWWESPQGLACQFLIVLLGAAMCLYFGRGLIKDIWEHEESYALQFAGQVAVQIQFETTVHDMRSTGHQAPVGLDPYNVSQQQNAVEFQAIIHHIPTPLARIAEKVLHRAPVEAPTCD